MIRGAHPLCDHPVAALTDNAPPSTSLAFGLIGCAFNSSASFVSRRTGSGDGLFRCKTCLNRQHASDHHPLTTLHNATGSASPDLSEEGYRRCRAAPQPAFPPTDENRTRWPARAAPPVARLSSGLTHQCHTPDTRQVTADACHCIRITCYIGAMKFFGLFSKKSETRPVGQLLCRSRHNSTLVRQMPGVRSRGLEEGDMGYRYHRGWVGPLLRTQRLPATSLFFWKNKGTNCASASFGWASSGHPCAS